MAAHAESFGLGFGVLFSVCLALFVSVGCGGVLFFWLCCCLVLLFLLLLFLLALVFGFEYLG